MSRKKTVLVAILINAGLLLVLFGTALKKEASYEETPTLQLAQTSQAPPSSTYIVANQFSQEEMDHVLDQYVATPSFGERTLTQEIALKSEESVLAAPRESQVVAQKEIRKENREDPYYVNVTVKKGDFLEKIAKANNTTVAAIMKANQLSGSQLKIGQVLRIPLKEAPAVTPEPVKNNPLPAVRELSGEDYYIVKEGDNPWLIASKNNVKLEELLRINGLDDQKARKLRPGDRLRIR